MTTLFLSPSFFSMAAYNRPQKFKVVSDNKQRRQTIVILLQKAQLVAFILLCRFL